MQDYRNNKKGLPQLRNSPDFYPTLSHLVLWHFGQGGSVSVSSSNLITSPQLTHLYIPFPGFSPVVYIIKQFKRLIKLFTRFILIERGCFSSMIAHVSINPIPFPIFGSLSGSAVAYNAHVSKLFVLTVFCIPSATNILSMPKNLLILAAKTR